MATSGTSFQKKSKAKIVQIPGTKPSLHNNQLLVSSGIPSLDNVVGGGLAVGTILLIEEDKYGSYGRMMLKYFMAEGVMNKHELFLASADTNPQSLLDELPGPLLDDPVRSQTTEPSTDNMTIAWRYQNQPQVQSSATGTKFGHYYDLTKNMEPALINNTQKTLLNLSEDVHCSCGKLMRPAYAELLNDIQKTVQSGNYGTSTPQQHRNILRIGVHSLGSPQWGENVVVEERHSGVDPSLCRLLYALRALMRTAYAVCVITVPSHLFQDTNLSRRLQHLSDLSVRLESFAGSIHEKNPAYREYHGLFHLLKLPRLNSLSCHMPDTMDLAFKLRKKKFMIEKLHLPPELSDTANRSQEDPVPSRNTSTCGSGSGNSKLDF